MVALYYLLCCTRKDHTIRSSKLVLEVMIVLHGDLQSSDCLRQEYGHRVRLATHANFKEFVLTAGLEFYPLGGDPKVLAGCKYLTECYSV